MLFQIKPLFRLTNILKKHHIKPLEPETKILARVQSINGLFCLTDRFCTGSRLRCAVRLFVPFCRDQKFFFSVDQDKNCAFFELDIFIICFNVMNEHYLSCFSARRLFMVLIIFNMIK